MFFGYTTVSIMPLRAQDNDRSEMVSQLLFGELIYVAEFRNSWAYIRSDFDDYEGWVDRKQFVELTEEQFIALKSKQTTYTKKPISILYSLKTKHETRIFFGSHLIGFQNGKIRLNDEEFVVRDNPMEFNTIQSVDHLIQFARQFLGAPYLWGGKTPFGVDCSGFIQSIYKVYGIALPRDAYQQAEKGKLVDFHDDAQAGDLAFFENEEGKIIHVGMILKPGKIIHASAHVRVDKIDHHGIFNETIGDYTHTLRFIKRLL